MARKWRVFGIEFRIDFSLRLHDHLCFGTHPAELSGKNHYRSCKQFFCFSRLLHISLSFIGRKEQATFTKSSVDANRRCYQTRFLVFVSFSVSIALWYRPIMFLFARFFHLFTRSQRRRSRVDYDSASQRAELGLGEMRNDKKTESYKTARQGAS